MKHNASSSVDGMLSRIWIKINKNHLKSNMEKSDKMNVEMKKIKYKFIGKKWYKFKLILYFFL